MKTDQKRVIITGATDGLGLRLAWLFAGQNAQLLVTGRKSRQELKFPLPPDARYVVADQSDPDCANIIRSEIEQLCWDQVDHIVLNAGTGQIVDPLAEHPDAIAHVMTVNLVTPIELVNQLSHLFLVNGNSITPQDRTLITFIGSTSAKGAAGFASYAASKAGITGFVRAIASEWQNRVDVQIIHPGPTATRMHEKAGLKPGLAGILFVDPDYSADRILKLIQSRKPVATIGMLKFALYNILSKIGLVAKPARVIPL